MTIDCENKLDAMGFAITRIRDLGVPGESLIPHSNHIMDGWVVVSKDRPGRNPWFNLFRQETCWESVKAYAGLL